MLDTIIKGTGNSRFLRSSIPENITFSEFVSLLRAGTFPIDLAGINDEGIEVKGTALSKGTLLSDRTETALWGTAADRTVDEALSYSFSALMGYAGAKATVVTGTYVGDGAESQTISLGFTPRVLIIAGKDYTSSSVSNSTTRVPILFTTERSPIKQADLYGPLGEIIDCGFKVYYSSENSSGKGYRYLNNRNTTWYYIAIA